MEFNPPRDINYNHYNQFPRYSRGLSHYSLGKISLALVLIYTSPI